MLRKKSVRFFSGSGEYDVGGFPRFSRELAPFLRA